MDSSEDHVKQILRVHQRAPITLGQSLHIERTGILPHSLVLMTLEARPSGPWEPLDPAATSSAILHEPRQCPGGRAIARHLDWSAAYGYRVAFANFWCRHGRSVEVRNGFIHVEFVGMASTMVCPSLLLTPQNFLPSRSRHDR
jgi:hypothetical protein